MKHCLKFSIIIANYNYARFLNRAIDSALELRWPSVEVIVVDDGSSDNSGQLIHAYGKRIKARFQSNSGQRVANNTGFDAATGDVIIFLDADDALEPDMAQEVASVWRQSVSKVQVQMLRVDADEKSLGLVIPRLKHIPSAEDVRRWARATMEYPTPPGSGNAYSRLFLERIFPLDATRDNFTDSTCIAMAPFLGDVATIARPLVRYRMHGSNDSSLLGSDANFGREVARALKRLKAAQDACRMQDSDPPADEALRSGAHLIQLRAASLRLDPAGHPLPDDRRISIIADAIALPFKASFESLNRRLMFAAFSILTLVLPVKVARVLVRRRFSHW